MKRLAIVATYYAVVALTVYACMPRREPIEPPAEINCAEACVLLSERGRCGIRVHECTPWCDAHDAALCIGRAAGLPRSPERRCFEAGRCGS